MQRIDDFLNKITMYRLVLYYTLGLLLIALALSLFGAIHYSPVAIIFSAGFITATCYVANWIFAWAFDAQVNVESLYITALILSLIIAPVSPHAGIPQIAFLFWAGVLAIGSKFILAIHKKHIFNPAALAVAVTAFTLNQAAVWWVGTPWLLPFVLVGGILMVRKLRRWDMVFGFLLTTVAASFILSAARGSNLLLVAKDVLFYSSLFFFAFVMLTEPLTAPPTKGKRIVYGILVGILFAPQVHFGGLYFTPELALLAGNVFAYLVSPKEKLMLTLKDRIQLTPDTYDFIFEPDRKMAFKPGQYLEWTLGYDKPDSRGNRRYFTISSAPTEKEIAMGVKFYSDPSTFKRKLGSMKLGDKIFAGQLAGDFTLPRNKKEKLVFIAGGIGVTPFRSMIKYLLDAKEQRDIVVFYAANGADQLAYKDIFDRAQRELAIRTIYATDKRVTMDMVKNEAPDYAARTFYISGPRAMVTSFENTLKELGVRGGKVKTDFFPGFA